MGWGISTNFLNRNKELTIKDNNKEKQIYIKKKHTNFENSQNKKKDNYSQIQKKQLIRNYLNNLEIESNPQEINISYDLVKDSYMFFGYDNAFTVFYSDDSINLVYSNYLFSIISYNVIDNKKINEIKNAHHSCITNFRHMHDKKNERDLIISVSNDNNLKLWDYKNFECLLNIEKVYKKGYLNSASFINYNNLIYIITSNHSFSSADNKPIIIYDLYGNIIKQIIDSNENTVFIDSFYDKKRGQIFIITGHYKYIKSYDFERNSNYFKYKDDKDNGFHTSIIINDKGKNVKMIESSDYRDIRIWNFHNGQLLKKIQINNKLFGICLWSNKYLFAGAEKGIINLIDLEIGKTIKILNNHKDSVLTIKKIKHPVYGECIISLSHDETIKLWSKQNK